MAYNDDPSRTYNDWRTCQECKQPYSPDEVLDSNVSYWSHPYNYGQGSRTFCLACWLGVGPNDLNDDFFPSALPTLVIQALLVPASRTAEGQLIEAVQPAWLEIVRLIREDPDVLYKIPPRKMEEMIAGAYRRSGFDQVTLTPHSGDFGRDVIAVRSGWGSIRIVDQVKAYKPGHLVTADEVRALGFVMLADQAATKGIVTTTSDFAPRIADDPLIRPFLGTRIELINGKHLAARLARLLA